MTPELLFAEGRQLSKGTGDLKRVPWIQMLVGGKGPWLATFRGLNTFVSKRNSCGSKTWATCEFSPLIKILKIKKLALNDICATKKAAHADNLIEVVKLR